jgi:hypothetical protein
LSGLIIEHGNARFLVGEPHPTVSTQAFAQSTQRDAGVRRALSGARTRLLHVRTEDELDKDGDRDHCRECEAVYYDYTRNRTIRVRGNLGGAAGHQVEVDHTQPLPSPDEWDEAVEIVRRSPVWGPLLEGQQLQPYRPMPPLLIPKGEQQVERTLYVGLVSKPRRFNRIVAVNMIRQEAAPEPVQPEASLAVAGVCGVPSAQCQVPRRGSPGTVTIEWPKDNPVWKFQAYRPALSAGRNGSGIELRNVRYQGEMVLKQAHVPILNVQYDDDVCGPFRDWLFDEWCFQANGTDIPGAPGFRWCDEPPQTIFESGVDGGNFTGVAVYEAEDGSLAMVSQCWAGWYRYIPEWRFYPDGRIRPIFKFGGTDSSCVCSVHHHHAYWRLDFDILGKSNRIEERIDGVWTPINTETSRQRTPETETRWRVLHAKKEIGYEIITGEHDDYGDEFSGHDQYALRYRKTELEDGPLHEIPYHMIDGAITDLAQYVAKQESVKKQDLVVWYAAHFRHNVEDEDAHDRILGPTLTPFNWPEPRRRK